MIFRLIKKYDASLTNKLIQKLLYEIEVHV